MDQALTASNMDELIHNVKEELSMRIKSGKVKSTILSGPWRAYALEHEEDIRRSSAMKFDIKAAGDRSNEERPYRSRRRLNWWL